MVLILAFGGRSRTSDGRQTVKIGVIAPLTGGGTVFGNSLVAGIKLAKEDLKNTKYNYELVIEDDRSNPVQSASAAQKLINIDKVQAIIVATSGTGNAILTLTEAAHIPQICVVCADKTIGQGKYNFTNSVLPEDEADVWIKEAVHRGIKTLGLISQIHPGINAVVDAVTLKAKENNIPIVYAERFDGNNRDFKTIISKAKKANADVYFLMAFPPSLDIVGKELKEAGVASVSGGAGALSIAADPSIFNDDWYTEVSLTDKDFLARFEKEFPSVRFNVRTAPFGYDSLNMLVDGFEKGADMSTYLAGITEYKGKVGTITKPSGNNFRSTPSVWMIKDGKPVPIESN